MRGYARCFNVQVLKEPFRRGKLRPGEHGGPSPLGHGWVLSYLLSTWLNLITSGGNMGNFSLSGMACC
jgi:hypothetical protein|nr:hypothetical protein Q903MT_gene4549 [Picea sitchensis]